METNSEHTFTITQYKKDAVVKRENCIATRGGKERGEVVELSRSSLKKLSFVANNSEVDFTHMMTMTYPEVFPEDGREVKRQLNLFLTRARQLVGGLSYLWFMEFQKRGAVHFHVMTAGAVGVATAFECSGVGGELRDIWVGIVAGWYRDGGMVPCAHHATYGLHMEPIRESLGAARYVAKYAAKVDQKQVPEWYASVGRFWGNSRDVKPRERGVVVGVPLVEFPEDRVASIEIETGEGETFTVTRPYKYQFDIGERGRLSKNFDRWKDELFNVYGDLCSTGGGSGDGS